MSMNERGKKPCGCRTHESLVLSVDHEQCQEDGLECNADNIRDEGRSSLGRDKGQAVDRPNDAVEESGDIREGRELLRALVGHNAAEGSAAQEIDPDAV